jgi:hypothetical protein
MRLFFSWQKRIPAQVNKKSAGAKVKSWLTKHTKGKVHSDLIELSFAGARVPFHPAP